MRKMIQGRLSVFKFESFKKYKGIAHFITTKEGWVSGSKSRFTGDLKEEYAEFRKELAISCEANANQFVFPRQTHSDHIAVVTSADENTIADTDALITNEPGIYFIPALIEKWKAEKINADFINFDRLESYLDFGGIRLEDDILVTETGCEMIGDRIPVTPDDVEEVMR